MKIRTNITSKTTTKTIEQLLTLTDRSKTVHNRENNENETVPNKLRRIMKALDDLQQQENT